MGKNETRAVDCELPSGGTRPFEWRHAASSYRIAPRIPHDGCLWQDVETTEEDTVKGRGLRNARDIENV